VNPPIRLDLVLREAVATPYSDLLTRPTGAAVRNRVITVIRERGDDDAALDFSSVGLMDFSCADEVIAKLLVATGDALVPRVVLRGVSEDHAQAIESALARYGLIVVALLAGTTEPRLLGTAPDDCRAVFKALVPLRRAPAGPLATALAWPLVRATEALQELARHRCVVAFPDATFAIGAVT
jgi:hypothetical protein